MSGQSHQERFASQLQAFFYGSVPGSRAMGNRHERTEGLTCRRLEAAVRLLSVLGRNTAPGTAAVASLTGRGAAGFAERTASRWAACGRAGLKRRFARPHRRVADAFGVRPQIRPERVVAATHVSGVSLARGR